MLSIDPGKNGGIAWRDVDGIVQAVKMPDGMTAQCDRLRELRSALIVPQFACAIEKTGTYVKGNAVGGACKFARHNGHLEAALYCLGIPVVENPAPGVWQRSLGVLPKDKGERKRAIREMMARRHPHLKVTLATADALAILGWAEGRAK